jgi:hypothetical protein
MLAATVSLMSRRAPAAISSSTTFSCFHGFRARGGGFRARWGRFRARGVDSGPEGVDSGPEVVDSGPEGWIKGQREWIQGQRGWIQGQSGWIVMLPCIDKAMHIRENTMHISVRRIAITIGRSQRVRR